MAPFVPRIRLTFPMLASAGTVLLVFDGSGKRDPLQRLADGEDLPSARTARSGNVRWFVDEAAADA